MKNLKETEINIGLEEEGLQENLSPEDVFLLEMGMKLPCSIEELKTTLTPEKIDQVGKLSEKGFVYLRWNDTIPHQSYQELVFTLYGNLAVFKVKNSVEIAAFKDMLEANGYNSDIRLIDDFLITSDLSLAPEEVLTIERLEHFSNVYDRYVK